MCGASPVAVPPHGMPVLKVVVRVLSGAPSAQGSEQDAVDLPSSARRFLAGRISKSCLTMSPLVSPGSGPVGRSQLSKKLGALPPPFFATPAILTQRGSPAAQPRTLGSRATLPARWLKSLAEVMVGSSNAPRQDSSPPPASNSEHKPGSGLTPRSHRLFAAKPRRGLFAPPPTAPGLKPRWVASAPHRWIPPARLAWRDLTCPAGPAAGPPFGAVWAWSRRAARSVAGPRAAPPTGLRLEGTAGVRPGIFPRFLGARAGPQRRW